MSYAIQRRSGLEQNKLYRDDTGIHDWYRFVLSFPPHLVRCYLEKFQLNRDCIVLDPFCGTGTTLVESKKHGIASIGVEANPVVQMAARAKVDWNIDCAALLEHSLLVAEVAEKRIKKYGNSLKSLAADKQNLLIKHSISPIPLHKSLVFFEVLNDLGDSGFYDIECTAFAKQLVYSYSNLQFGPEVGVGLKRKNDVDVVQLWLEQIRKIVADLRQYTAANSIATEVYLGDARSISTILNGKSIDAVITSPPYPNEKDYTRTTRLESVLT